MNTLGDNSLKEEIEKLLQLRNEAEAENNDDYYFGAPVDEDEMSSWERDTGITIPESYKEWLRFSKESMIDGTTASFWGPKKFHSKYVADEFVVIGEMIGDGEVVGFSKKSGHFIECFEGRIIDEYDDFKGVLNEIIRLLGKPQKIDQERIEQMHKKLKEIRERRNKK
ncbi:MAG: hypothetical protein K2M82_06520 [Lachnospiraceae bacterium]|nr:hypothetical protein [Lachnospiraceae bacterium]